MSAKYSDLLRDPRWQKKRLKIMQRDKFRCRECGADQRTLNVDHAFYLRDKLPWEYEDRDLRTLCEVCHSQLTAQRTVMSRVVGRLDLKTLKTLIAWVSDGGVRDVAALAGKTVCCVLCGAHRGMKPGRFLCGSCRYDPRSDADVF
jgi:hypothetical protein